MTKSGFSERAKKLSSENFNVNVNNSQSNSHNPGFRYHSSIHDVGHGSTAQKQAALNNQTAQQILITKAEQELKAKQMKIQQ